MGAALLAFAGRMLVIVTAPGGNGLLQSALSRSREFNTDLDAIELTSGLDGMAMALRKLEPCRPSWIFQ